MPSTSKVRLLRRGLAVCVPVHVSQAPKHGLIAQGSLPVPGGPAGGGVIPGGYGYKKRRAGTKNQLSSCFRYFAKDSGCTENIRLTEGKANPFAVKEVQTFHDDQGGALRGSG